MNIQKRIDELVDILNKANYEYYVLDRPNLTDQEYVTDIMPAADMKFKTLFEGRYFATPKKMGAQTAEANINAGIAAANQIVDFFTTGNTRFQVNNSSVLSIPRSH